MKIIKPLVERKSDYIFNIPIEGKADLKIKIGDTVKFGDVLFKKEYKRALETYNVIKELEIYKEDPKEFMVRLNGEFVTTGEILAERLVRGGLVVKKIFATVDGILSYERIDEGYVDILSEHISEDVVSTISGRVMDINLSKQVSIKSSAFYLKSITEQTQKIEGTFVTLGKGDSVYTSRDLEDTYEGCIVFAGRFVFTKLLEEIFKKGAKLIVVWSMEYMDYEQFKDKVVVLGGFGQIPFDYSISNILNSFNNSYVSIENKEVIFPDRAQIILREKLRIIESALEVNNIVKIVDVDNYTSLAKVVDVSSDDRYVTIQNNLGDRVLYPIETLIPID